MNELREDPVPYGYGGQNPKAAPEPIVKDCCLTCAHYIPPRRKGAQMFVDGPLYEVCTVDFDGKTYRTPGMMAKGDKITKPDHWCEKFTRHNRKSPHIDEADTYLS